MTVQITTIMKPKRGQIAEAVKFCHDAGKMIEQNGGKFRLFTAMAAGHASGELIGVSEWETMEEYGRLMDKGPPQAVIGRLSSGEEPPVELVSINIGMEVPDRS